MGQREDYRTHVNTIVLLVSLATFVSTLAGGVFALRFRDLLHLILGFGGGAVLGVVLFDLVPESIQLSAGHVGMQGMMTVLSAAFLGYMVLDRAVVMHGGSDGADRHTVRRGVLGAGSLCVHSILDGFFIGLSFKISTAVGAVVAMAVLVHDFSDGINIVGVILKNRGSDRKAFRWLLLDALAPVLGAASTLLFTLQGPLLGLGLAGFARFFL